MSREITRLKAWAHRRGLARTLNSTHHPGGWARCTVQTRVGGAIGRRLARWAATRPGRPRVTRVTPIEGMAVEYRHVWRCQYERRG